MITMFNTVPQSQHNLISSLPPLQLEKCEVLPESYVLPEKCSISRNNFEEEMNRHLQATPSRCYFIALVYRRVIATGEAKSPLVCDGETACYRYHPLKDPAFTSHTQKKRKAYPAEHELTAIAYFSTRGSRTFTYLGTAYKTPDSGTKDQNAFHYMQRYIYANSIDTRASIQNARLHLAKHFPITIGRRITVLQLLLHDIPWHTEAQRIYDYLWKIASTSGFDSFIERYE